MSFIDSGPKVVPCTTPQSVLVYLCILTMEIVCTPSIYILYCFLSLEGKRKNNKLYKNNIFCNVNLSSAFAESEYVLNTRSTILINDWNFQDY